MDITESALKRRVFRQDLYDLHVREFMVGQTAQFIDPHRNVVDVGAAVGLYSSFWADKCRRLYAYEAVPIVFEQTKKLAARFNNVDARNKALTDFVGEATFYVDGRRLSNSSLQRLVDGPAITVAASTLDDEEIDDVGFLKIDVEGVELRVLRGGEKTIGRDRPVCMVEVYPKYNDGPVESTFTYMADLGYTAFYNHRAHGLKPLDGVQHAVDVACDEGMWAVHDCDFLFVPKEIGRGRSTNK